ncbi:MAG: hypothetical protein ACXABY_14630 [Candidatus Thorarchaeota archaeon]|jgi:hypothetical protein
MLIDFLIGMLALIVMTGVGWDKLLALAEVTLGQIPDSKRRGVPGTVDYFMFAIMLLTLPLAIALPFLLLQVR